MMDTLFTALRKAARQTIPLLQGMLLASIPAGAAFSDDTEVFKVSLSVEQATSLRPNVLFILDTSGSMGIEVDDVQPFKTAKPETFYDGREGNCRHDRIYWSKAPHKAPSCSTNRFFPKSRLRCKAALEQLNQGGTGRFQDRLARFNPKRRDWRPLGTKNKQRNAPHIECRADRGKHGETDSSTRTYATSGSTEPWRVSPTGEIDWETTGDFYTLFSGKYLNYVHNVQHADPGQPNRLEVMQAAANQIAAINRHNILAGIMRFDTTAYRETSNAGGPVLFPIQPISTPQANGNFQSVVDNLNAQGATPLSETFYEAFLYYTGRTPFFGTLPHNRFKSVPSSMSEGKYISPIKLECQKNFIVYLTDGEPVVDQFAESRINTFLSSFNSDPKRLSGKSMKDTFCKSFRPFRRPFIDTGDNCMDELAEYMANLDHSSLAGDQPIRTFTIGFHTDQQLLKDTARKGRGTFHEAKNAIELNEAFLSILSAIQQQTTTFSAPTVSVNAFNRITNLDDLFFSVFTPTNNFRWPGNLKRYQLQCAVDHPSLPDFCADGPDEGTDPDPPVIVDADGDPAVDKTTGFFKDTARSIWTDITAGDDGHETRLGGIAHTFGGYTGVSKSNDDPPNPSRTVYTYTGGYTNTNGTFTPSGQALLSHSDNVFVETNAKLIKEVDVLPAGAPDGDKESFFYPDGRDSSEPTLTDLVKFARGIDVQDLDTDSRTTDARHEVGDALHARPRVVTYGGTDTNPDLALFTITNDGYLHAVKVSDGSELFSWMPQELLSKVAEQFNNSKTTSKSYGLDGAITVWVNDVDNDGKIRSADGDHVYLYVGQRRGGRSYWALDVTNRTNPKLLWKITGGLPNTDFLELGQTWSVPHKSKVKLDGTVRDVLFFAGGYDTIQDAAGAPIADTMGRALFMVDAKTGRRLWHAGNPTMLPTPNLKLAKMTNSIPSEIRIFDITGDGLDDRIYVGDTRGQLWRFDIHNATNKGASATSPSEFITGGAIAEFQKGASTTPGVQDNRRFYYRPDVTLATPEEAQPFLAVTIGSGYRAHPLDKQTRDRFYMIRDPNIGNVKSYPTPFTEADLLNITDNLTPTRTQLFGTPTNPKVGWMLDLNDADTGNFIGEKSLAEPVVFNNMVLFTTFLPPSSELTDNCQPTQGTGRVFAINLFNGSPVRDLDGDGTSKTFTRGDRHLKLLRGGIPPNVVILFSKLNGVVPIAFVAAEQLDMEFSDAPVKTYWFQQEVQ